MTFEFELCSEDEGERRSLGDLEERAPRVPELSKSSPMMERMSGELSEIEDTSDRDFGFERVTGGVISEEGGGGLLV